jgi:hypothetical protein
LIQNILNEQENNLKILKVNIIRKDNYAILNSDDKNINKLVELFYTIIKVNSILNNKDKYNLVAFIGGICSYYNLFDNDNIKIFRNYFKN